ncbi:MAG: hypothetical protein WA642_10195, partial [Steroidobacteraceae bacterium]
VRGQCPRTTADTAAARLAPLSRAAILTGSTHLTAQKRRTVVPDDILLAIDQGTSSTRAIGFSAAGDVLAVAQ